jgi:UDP-N-acetylmuramoylalanine--D-glutamate ligase
MNYNKNEMDAYLKDKYYIFSNQKKEDLLIVGRQAMPFVKKWSGRVREKLTVPPLGGPTAKWGSFLFGAHNRYNISLAIEVGRRLGIKDSIIKKAVKSFKGVEGRLELVREVRGVKFYNDTTATTPDATIAAFEALSSQLGHPMSKLGGKRIILIMGGSDKDLDMTNLLEILPRYAREVVLLSGSGSNRIKRMIKGYKEVGSMKEAVEYARTNAHRGDIILLSPAFTSFGMFRNEFHRGEEFVKLVNSFT